MAKRKVICTGSIKDRKGNINPCNRIIAEIEYVNDANIEIKCGKCGTMNTIHAEPRPKLEKESSSNILGTFTIERIST